MKYKLKEFFKGVLYVILIIVAIIPLVYWFIHPDLTKMQVFLKTWWCVVVEILSLLIILKLEK